MCLVKVHYNTWGSGKGNNSWCGDLEPVMSSNDPIGGKSIHQLRKTHAASRSRLGEKSNHFQLVSLNFKVPFVFRQRLKILAASSSLTMTELVLAAVDAFDVNMVKRSAPSTANCEDSASAGTELP
jgi:hypothetical protein